MSHEISLSGASAAVQSFSRAAAPGCAISGNTSDIITTLLLRPGAGMDMVRNAAGDLTYVNTRYAQMQLGSLAGIAGSVTLPSAGASSGGITAANVFTSGVFNNTTQKWGSSITMSNPTCNQMMLFISTNTFGTAVTGSCSASGHIVWVNNSAVNSSFNVMHSLNACAEFTTSTNYQDHVNSSVYVMSIPAGGTAVVDISRGGRANNITGIGANRTATNTAGAGDSSFVVVGIHGL